MIDVSRALAVDGWMTGEELNYLAEMASASRLVCEVGSWMGRSTCAIAANIQGAVWAVDTWRGSAEHVSTLANKPSGWLYERFLTNTKGLPAIPIMLPSLEAAALLQRCGVKADMIFIDANHTYDSVKADIQAWMPLLVEGGIICGHDYDPPNWMGIKRAVDECMPKFRIVPGTTIWSTEGCE